MGRDRGCEPRRERVVGPLVNGVGSTARVTWVMVASTRWYAEVRDVMGAVIAP